MAKQKLGSFNDVTTIDDTYHIPSLKKNNNNFNILPSDLAKSQSIWHSGSTSITAFAGGGQASATQLTSEYNNVTVCATAADSVKALTGNVNSHFRVVNNGAAACSLYPKTGENFLGLAANTSISIPVGAEVDCFCYATGVWTYRIESINFYIANGTFTGTRTVSQGGYNLIFSGATATDYVGFGITPTAKVHVKGINALSSDFVLKADNTSGNIFAIRNDAKISVGNSTYNFKFNVNSSAAQDFISIELNNVVQGALGYRTQGGTLELNNAAGSAQSVKFNIASEDDRINTGNNLAIGSNFASYKVDVTGQVNASSGFRYNGTNGFTGTGAYTNFTIEGGIITSAS